MLIHYDMQCSPDIALVRHGIPRNLTCTKDTMLESYPTITIGVLRGVHGPQGKRSRNFLLSMPSAGMQHRYFWIAGIIKLGRSYVRRESLWHLSRSRKVESILELFCTLAVGDCVILLAAQCNHHEVDWKTPSVLIEVVVGDEAGGNLDEHSTHVPMRPAATLFRMLSGVNGGGFLSIRNPLEHGRDSYFR
jgi:hypothetical protein